MEWTFVDDPGQLGPALSRIDEAIVGVDVERADSLQYFRTSALIQVGTAMRAVLVDAVTLAPVPRLSDFLSGRTCVLHALNNDLEPLRAVGVEVGTVEDTAVAATLLGLPSGLDPLLRDRFDVTLSPDKQRFQRADWGQRPLPDDMASYAAGDVVHLPALWANLSTELDRRERRSWYEQERSDVVAAAFEDTRDWTRTRGAGQLSARQRAVLKALWEEREGICQEFNLAPNWVLRDRVLVDLARDPAADPTALVRRNQRRSRPTPAHADRLFLAQQAGLDAPPVVVTSPGTAAPHPAHRDAFDAMRRARAEVAEGVGLDPGVLCPSRSLRAPSRDHPSGPAQLCRLAGLRPWQAELLGDALWAAYVDAVTDPTS